MSWQTPKTDWTARDFFELDPDFLRMNANLRFLQQQAAQTVGLEDVGVRPMPRLGQPADPALLNRIEQDTARLAEACITDFLPHPDFLPGDAFWNWRDLNRLEEAMRQTEAALRCIRTAQPVLSFTMGGDFFGA